MPMCSLTFKKGLARGGDKGEGGDDCKVAWVW